ncbi:hypothetical protein [Qipengyuania sp.]|uniref:hypothetical protein n=1 Tax=Qipengyuania sp. TaxID=2004515 RepID=UPI0037370EF7
MPEVLAAALAAVLALGACASGVNGAAGTGQEDAGKTGDGAMIDCTVTGKAASAARANGACEEFVAALGAGAHAARIAAITLAAPTPDAAEAIVTLSAGDDPLQIQFDSMDREMDRAAWQRFAQDTSAYLDNRFR